MAMNSIIKYQEFSNIIKEYAIKVRRWCLGGLPSIVSRQRHSRQRWQQHWLLACPLLVTTFQEFPTQFEVLRKTALMGG